MAVSNRTRFEVLKRDNHTCRYCGAKAPDVTLHVDHVIPVALGGSDKPDNLVAACETCNLGKASTTPDDDVVADVDARALAWKDAILEAADILATRSQDRARLIAWFGHAWMNRYQEPVGTLPNDWEETVTRFHNLGIPQQLMSDNIDIAAQKYMAIGQKFRYFCGICWNQVNEIQGMAQKIMTDADHG